METPNRDACASVVEAGANHVEQNEHRASWPAGIEHDSRHEDGEPDDVSPKNGQRAEDNAALRKMLGRRLEAARTLNGWGQMEAAILMGYQNSTQLSLWEDGKRMPPLNSLLIAADVYGVSLDYLVSASDEPERDARTAARMALMRRAERLLKENAGAITEAVMNGSRETRLDAMRAAKFTSHAEELVSAALALQRSNPAEFEDLRGGARLVRVAAEMQEALLKINSLVDRGERIHQQWIARVRAHTQAALVDRTDGIDEQSVARVQEPAAKPHAVFSMDKAYTRALRRDALLTRIDARLAGGAA